MADEVCSARCSIFARYNRHADLRAVLPSAYGRGDHRSTSVQTARIPGVFDSDLLRIRRASRRRPAASSRLAASSTPIIRARLSRHDPAPATQRAASHLTFRPGAVECSEVTADRSTTDAQLRREPAHLPPSKTERPKAASRSASRCRRSATPSYRRALYTHRYAFSLETGSDQGTRAIALFCDR